MSPFTAVIELRPPHRLQRTSRKKSAQSESSWASLKQGGCMMLEDVGVGSSMMNTVTRINWDLSRCSQVRETACLLTR